MTPTLAEDKRKQLDDIVGKMHSNGEPDENIQTVINDFKSKYASTGILGKVRNFLTTGNPSRRYNPAPAEPGKSYGIFQGNPEGTLDFKPWVNRAAMLAGGAEAGASILSNPQPIMNLLRSAYTGMKAGAPDIGVGAAQAGVGMGAVKGLEGTPFSHVPIWTGVLPGIRNLASGIGKSARAFAGEFNPANLRDLFTSESTGAVGENIPFTPKVPIGKVTAPAAKGPSLEMLKEALSSGSITPEQFEAQLSKLPYDEETKGIIKANMQSKLAPKASTTPGETPKALSLGHLQSAVKEGLIDIEDFPGELEKLGYNERDRGILTKLLESSIQKEKEAEESVGKVVGSKGPGGQEPGKAKPLVKPPEAPQLPETPGHEAFLEVGPPHKPPITQQQIEEAQLPSRTAKENRLAQHLNEKYSDLTKVPKTSEFLKSVQKDAGLKYPPSLRTLEGAIKKAQMLRFPSGTE